MTVAQIFASICSLVETALVNELQSQSADFQEYTWCMMGTDHNFFSFRLGVHLIGGFQ